MARKIRFLAASIAKIVLVMSVVAGAQTNAAPGQSGYAPVDGLKMYYEIHGTGQPLVLIHGGLGSTGMFDPILPVLSKGGR